MPSNLQEKENIAEEIYNFGYITRNWIVNNELVINTIYVEEEVAFSLNTDLPRCEKSGFWDPHDKHITTEDLRIIENKKLRKRLTKGSYYREPRSISFSKYF